MKVTNTNELSSFVAALKDWAQNHAYEGIVASIESAEKTSFTASELIIKYSETLKALKSRIPENIPPSFRENWDEAIRVGSEAVETIEYPEKKRSFWEVVIGA